ncbi:MAG: hypothetical protein JW768_09815 [Chitinispirillaceae bacterium]|nr:hypothetical protein [Chitinispirillaceae bacterium]
MTPTRRHGICVWTIGLAMVSTAAFLLHCTASLTGGNSSETTNVAVVAGDGLPAASVTAKLIHADNWAYRVMNNTEIVADSAVAGPDGIVSFDRLPEMPCNLQIDYAGSGIFIRNFSDKGKITAATDTIRLQKYATLLGTCSPDGSFPSSVMLEGTIYSAAVGSDRSFSFAEVAPGSYPLVFLSLSGELAIAGSALLAPDQTIARSVTAPNFTELLIDDFESGYHTSVLGQFTDATWYSYADTGAGGTSSVSRSLQTGAPQGVFYLDATIIMKTPQEGAWAGIGVPIGLKRSDWDLSAMTAVSFWARGKRTMRVSIESPFVDSINNNWPDFGKAIVLDSTWRYYRIPVDSLILPASKALTLGVTWAMASKRIYRIEFEAVSTASSADTIRIQIDDIRLEGITAPDLFRQMETGTAQ